MAGVSKVDLHLQDGPERGPVYENEDWIQVMRIRLAPGETLPPHSANSQVLLVPLQGRLGFVGEGAEEVFGVGEALSVPLGTAMDVKNVGEETAIFLVVKTPHPRSLG